MKRRNVALLAGGLFLGLVFLVPGLIHLWVDWLWFQEVGFEPVFVRELVTKAVLFVAAGAVAFGFLFGNLRLAQRGRVFNPVLVKLNPEAPPVDVTELLRKLALPLALFLSAIVALSATRAWMVVLQFVNRVPFGSADPVFSRDVGFYIFSLPALAAGLESLLALVVFGLMLAVPLYWLRGDIIVAPQGVRVEPSAARHMGVLVIGLFLALGLQNWFLRVPELLYSTTGPLVGASYADLHARLPGLRIAAVTAVVSGVIVGLGLYRQRLVPYAVIAAVLYGVVSIGATRAYPAAVQRFAVAPTELTMEEPQLRHHLEATRRAWALDNVEIRDITGDARLTLADLENNRPTIDNVRLWDRDPLLQTYGQLQEIRTYYDFISVDDDRYWIDGAYRQVLISPRELNSASLPTRTFINEHLTFTHGMGVTLGPANQVTEEGLPVLFIKDLPPVSSVSIEVTRPQIYYGELTNNFVFTATRRPEFDYPSGEANHFTSYTGAGGVASGGLVRRALLAWRFGTLNILLSRDITGDSRILYHRNIRERAARALPFLRFDADPYIVITEDGELKWILDAYTTSRRYPYAQRLGDGTNYMRNSVKVVIDAYDGDIQAYIADPHDPIIQTYDRIFPGIFQPLTAMTENLRAHIRYPEDLYRVQTQLFATYHMREPELFYHREDQWQIPSLGDGERRDLFMRRIIMRLPDGAEPEFIFMTPFTPRQKDNLASWMVARSDGEHYGRLAVYRFPKQSLVFGPRQVVNRINQDTEIARQVSLWDQRGSQVIRGELLVIPVEESLIYVQPLYLRAEGGRIPELKRVIVAYQNQVVMEETLEEGLEVLFGLRRPSIPQVTPGELGDARVVADVPALPARPDGVDPELMRRALEHHERAQREIDQLGELIRRMNTDNTRRQAAPQRPAAQAPAPPEPQPQP
jgi:uncharacterized protein